jgi:hypothetical protein
MGEADGYIARLEEALRECVRLSGADLSGGFPTWPELPEFAVQEVRQMREDYNECMEREWQEFSLRKRIVKLEDGLRKMVPGKRPDSTYNYDREACRQIACELLGEDY